MNVDAMQHEVEWLEDKGKHRARVKLDERDQDAFDLAESEWMCRECGTFLEDEWEVCGCREAQ